VPEEVGLTSNEDDLDLDFEEGISIDVTSSPKTATAEHDLVDEVADKTHLPTAANVDCRDISAMKLNPGSNDQENQKVNVGASHVAEYKTDELPSQTFSDSSHVDVSLPVTKSIPGKALAVDSMSEVDSMFDPQDDVKVQSEPASSTGLGSSTTPVVDGCAADKNSVLSQPSKKTNNKSVSMSMYGLIMLVCS